MFDIGFLELIVIAVIALVVLGPERLPVAIKTTALWVSKIKRSFQSIRTEIERELNVDEIRREIHNNAVMDELKRTREELQRTRSELDRDISAMNASQTPSDAGSSEASANSSGASAGREPPRHS